MNELWIKIENKFSIFFFCVSNEKQFLSQKVVAALLISFFFYLGCVVIFMFVGVIILGFGKGVTFLIPGARRGFVEAEPLTRNKDSWNR